MFWLSVSPQICQIENISCLSRLRLLNLSGNRITRVENLQGLNSLTELNLRHNSITSVVRNTHTCTCTHMHTHAHWSQFNITTVATMFHFDIQLLRYHWWLLRCSDCYPVTHGHLFIMQQLKMLHLITWQIRVAQSSCCLRLVTFFLLCLWLVEPRCTSAGRWRHIVSGTLLLNIEAFREEDRCTDPDSSYSTFKVFRHRLKTKRSQNIPSSGYSNILATFLNILAPRSILTTILSSIATT